MSLFKSSGWESMKIRGLVERDTGHVFVSLFRQRFPREMVTDQVEWVVEHYCYLNIEVYDNYFGGEGNDFDY
jgi:hypothetical protein